MKYTIQELKDDVELTYGCLGNEDDHLSDILEVLDRATPKKVIENSNIYGGIDMDCPYCETTQGMWKHDYCPHCGQAIDWKKEV